MTRLLSLLALLLLAACTGSTEAPVPVLLVVGFDRDPGAAGADLELVRADLDPTQSSLTFVPGSTRTLAAPAADFDVVDRENARGSLVVLSRASERTPTGSVGTLTTFRLIGIDPENPVNFAETSEVVLNEFQVVPTTLGPNPVFCPKRVQVTQSGVYAAVLHDPGLCGLQLPPFVDILDLQGSRLLQRLNTFPASSSGLYLAQGASEDLLYYATRAAGGLRLQEVTMPRPGQSFGPDDRVTPTEIASVRIAAGQNDALDLQRSGSGAEERLVFLYRESLVSVTGFGSTGEAEVGDFVRTARNNAFIVRDDDRGLEGTFVLSTPEANTLAFIPPPDRLETVSPEATASLGAVGATLEPTRDTLYFALPGQIAFVPLASFSSGDDLPDLLPPTAILELTNPSFITFAQAVPSTSVPTPSANAP